MPSTLDYLAFGSGYDLAEDDLDALYELGEDYEFERYRLGTPQVQYHPEEKLVMDGLLQSHRRGLPWFELKLQYVTEDEAALLEELVGGVTVNFKTRLSSDWELYNGEFQHPEWGDFDQQFRHFLDVVVTVKSLRLVGA